MEFCTLLAGMLTTGPTSASSFIEQMKWKNRVIRLRTDLDLHWCQIHIGHAIRAVATMLPMHHFFIKKTNGQMYNCINETWWMGTAKFIAVITTQLKM